MLRAGRRAALAGLALLLLLVYFVDVYFVDTPQPRRAPSIPPPRHAPSPPPSPMPGAAPPMPDDELTPVPPPVPTFADVCSLPEFAPSVPRLNLTIIVFAWRRFASLQRLLRSLKAARFCGHAIPLRVLIDGGAVPEVISEVQAYEWPHGPKEILSFEDLALGIRGMWINSSRPDISDSEHVLPLEDDIEVSPLFYWWLMRASRAYGSWSDGRAVHASKLVGVSLYTPRLNEIAYPQVQWRPDRATGSPTFLLQVPCSWEALCLG